MRQPKLQRRYDSSMLSLSLSTVEWLSLIIWLCSSSFFRRRSSANCLFFSIRSFCSSVKDGFVFCFCCERGSSVWLFSFGWLSPSSLLPACFARASASLINCSKMSSCGSSSYLRKFKLNANIKGVLDL